MMKNKFFLICFFSFLTILFCRPVLASTTSDFFGVTHDAYLDGFSQTTNRGSGYTNLDLYNGSAPQSYRPIVQFYLPANYCQLEAHGNPGDVIVWIGLALFKTVQDAASPSEYLQLYESWDNIADVSIPWEEDTSTWQKTGTTTPEYWPNGSDYYGGEVKAQGSHKLDQHAANTYAVNNWEYWTVYDIIGTTTQADVNAGGPLSLVVAPTYYVPGNVNMRFASSEYTLDTSHRPRLEIMCAPPTEPTPPTPPTPPTTPEDRFYILGDYVVPRYINCYVDNSYCDMVFGYSNAVYSRSLASTTSDLPEYPRFTWFWPNVFGKDIASSSIRYFIDIGQQGLSVNFTFPRPTSTTDYVLEIHDAYNTTGTTTDFVVRANLLGSSTESQTFSSCLGECPDLVSLPGRTICALKVVVCWSLAPDEKSTLYIRGATEKIKSKFPFSVFFDLTSKFQAGLTMTDDRDGTFDFPMMAPTATSTRMYWVPVISSSTIVATFGTTTVALIRNSIVWVAYLFAALAIFIFLIKNQRK